MPGEESSVALLCQIVPGQDLTQRSRAGSEWKHAVIEAPCQGPPHGNLGALLGLINGSMEESILKLHEHLTYISMEALHDC